MNKELLEREAYNEQMFEQRANGIATITFEQWQARNKARDEFFKNWNAVREESAEMIAEARCS
jgi:hypothetical protein|tara:strand:- start:430 stop:618 length:189 start_codon:yes stop_codon:yes gene_type:complete